MHERCPAVALIITVMLAMSNAAETSQPAREAVADAPQAQIHITGTVADSQGRPVESAKVTLYQTIHDEKASSLKVEAAQEELTGPDGAYSFTFTQGTNPYRARFLVARKDGLALGWDARRMLASRQSDIVLGEPKDLTGDVVDEKGQPIAEAEVGIAFAVMGKAEDCRLLAVPSLLNTKTDSNGHFRFANMPAEATFEFLVRKPGCVTLNTFTQTLFSDSASPLSIAQIASGAKKGQFSPRQTEIKFTLPLEARVEGMVVEKTSGKPVGGVQVTARADERQAGLLPPDPVTTVEDGTFRIGGLAAGNWSVELATIRGQVAEWVAEPAPVSLKADETQSGVRLELAQGSIIEVLVKDGSGKPIAKAMVSVRDKQRAQHSGGITDENGLARVRVSPGEYQVSAPFKPGYVLQMSRKQISLEAGETKRVEFVLLTTPRVIGTVRDEAGKPLAGVKIAVTSLGTSEVVTQDDGEFALEWNPELSRLGGSTAALVARDVTHNLADIVEIDEQTDRLDFKLKPGVTLTGTVLNQEGKPLSNARILVALRASDRGASLGRVEQTTTGDNGTFEIKAIPAGRQYEVTAMATGYGTSHISVNASNLNDRRQNVGQFTLLLANLSISGIVVDSHDQPVTGATVHAIDGSLPPRGDVRTDATGRFVIKGVPAGMVLLMADAHGPTLRHGSIEANGGATGVVIVVSE